MTPRAIAAAAAFLSCIVAANIAATELGIVELGPLVFVAGTPIAGAAFLFRDDLQDLGGHGAVLAAIAAGGLLSALLSPALALASAVAFTISELADWTVYTPLRARGYVRAALASNVVGSIVDTVVFLWLAPFPLTLDALTGQVIVKIAVTSAAVFIAAFARRRAIA